MATSSGKIFSLAEANDILPTVSSITAEVVERLDVIRQQYGFDLEKGGPEVPEVILKEVEKSLSEWSEQVLQLGAHPKGFFTVDFQSFDPELLYCWTYGEDKIRYTHKVWESFTHRRPLSGGAEAPADHLKWIN